jgi:hypothetical protein
MKILVAYGVIAGGAVSGTVDISGAEFGDRGVFTLGVITTPALGTEIQLALEDAGTNWIGLTDHKGNAVKAIAAGTVSFRTVGSKLRIKNLGATPAIVELFHSEVKDD